MRLGIATRLAVVLALLGALAAGLTGFYVYEASRDLLVASAKNKLLTSNQVVLRRITLTREMVTRNLQMLSAHPASLRALQHPQTQDLDQLATLFRLMMDSNPAYFQIRLIAAHDHGIEVVRVDRDAVGLLRVDDADLQEKGHYAYVSETLKLATGQTYMSRIVINRERGAHAGEGKPALMMAMPVVDTDRGVQGVVVINLDLQGMFSLLAADLPSQFQLMLANGAGDILVHPDANLAFGFDRGQRQLVQEHMPPTLPMVRGDADSVVFEMHEGVYASNPVVAAFIGKNIEIASEDGRLLLGLTQPIADVVQEVDRLRVSIVNIVVGLSLACLVVAVVVASALSRPINAIGRAARFFAVGQVKTALPTHRQDEIGDLARSFSRMQDQISQQLEELESSRQELSDLARHDGLTGLANRRLFEERLQSALAQRRRHGGELALVFLDLDKFKDINDQQGHEAGDEVLKVVASRLRANTREVDTPARLGGDEFVVLLCPAPEPTQLAALARKLLEAVSVPIVHEQELLELGCSIGISRSPVDGLTAEELLAAADEAMYEVKQAGRNGFKFATPIPG